MNTRNITKPRFYASYANSGFMFGGEGGIRTLDELSTHTRVPVVQLCTDLFILYNTYILFSFSAVQIEQKNTR